MFPGDPKQREKELRELLFRRIAAEQSKIHNRDWPRQAPSIRDILALISLDERQIPMFYHYKKRSNDVLKQ